LILGFFLSSAAGAEKIAVLPAEDLSQGPNGVNFALTEYLEKAVASRGLEVISQDAVLSFMTRNRIRRLGFLDTYYILQARKELGADFILLGTVSQRGERPCAAFGMVLYLIRTGDARTIWSDSMGLSCNEMRNPFGVLEPHTTEDLLPIVAKDLLEEWPEDIGQIRDRKAFYELDDVDMGHQHIRSGQKITCRVWLRSVTDGRPPEVSLKVRGQESFPLRRKDDNLYQASWIAPKEEGLYPVSLSLRWPSGREQATLLGRYHVDNHSPCFVLDLKGVRLNGVVAFRDRIFAIPRFSEPEPISRWEFSVKDETGQTILRKDREGNLPTRFYWRGQTGNRSRVADGNYRIDLKVWDRAGNMAMVSEKVALMRNPPDMIVEARKQGNDIVLNIQSKGKVPMAFWYMEMLEDDGSLIKTAGGRVLPAEVDLPIPETSAELLLTARDILGNKLNKKIKDINLLIQHGKEKGVPANKWLKEF
ncbi:MAG: hypothetical protein U9Q89_06280, partial [Thermodesulfobacteriota bacterium]|nr:hypothetical protein [Thermodesulfobacteriota bacterium]